MQVTADTRTRRTRLLGSVLFYSLAAVLLLAAAVLYLKPVDVPVDSVGDNYVSCGSAFSAVNAESLRTALPRQRPIPAEDLRRVCDQRFESRVGLAVLGTVGSALMVVAGVAGTVVSRRRSGNTSNTRRGLRA